LLDYSNEKLKAIFDGFLSDQSKPNYTDGEEVPNTPPSLNPSISLKTEIIRLQRELSRLGCSPGQADGIIGPATLRAIQRFFHQANIEYDPANVDPTDIADLAVNKPSNFCPPPPTESIPVLAGTWRTNAICPSVVLNGQIQLSRLPDNNGIILYEAEYKVGNLVFAGIVNQDKMFVNFRLNLTKGNTRGSNVVSGEGSIKNSNVIYLRSSDNCEIVALRI
jgi:peptidoglycan hydrolase-like protein with peptidoglycan-binding domain